MRQLQGTRVEMALAVQPEKGYPGAGRGKADGVVGLKGPLFFRFRKANAPTSRGICFEPRQTVFSHSLRKAPFFVSGVS
jgi:hypothetical protein